MNGCGFLHEKAIYMLTNPIPFCRRRFLQQLPQNYSSGEKNGILYLDKNDHSLCSLSLLARSFVTQIYCISFL